MISFRIFLKFRIPKNKVFSEQAMHNFQLKLLSKGLGGAEEGGHLFDKKIKEARDILRREGKKELFTSIVYSIRKEMRYHSELIGKSFKNKMSEGQDRTLQNNFDNNVFTLDDVELPKFVLDV